MQPEGVKCVGSTDECLTAGRPPNGPHLVLSLVHLCCVGPSSSRRGGGGHTCW